MCEFVGATRREPEGRSEYRLRAGVYRVIYEFDRAKNILHLIAIGHRREVYK